MQISWGELSIVTIEGQETYPGFRPIRIDGGMGTNQASRLFVGSDTGLKAG